jgi:hypothetical protein
MDVPLGCSPGLAATAAAPCAGMAGHWHGVPARRRTAAWCSAQVTARSPACHCNELSRPRATKRNLFSDVGCQGASLPRSTKQQVLRGSMRRSPRLQDSPADTPRSSPDELASDGDHGHRRPAEVSESTGVERPPGTKPLACARPDRETWIPPWLAGLCSVPSRRT